MCVARIIIGEINPRWMFERTWKHNGTRNCWRLRVVRKARSTHSRLIVRLMTGVVFFTSLLPIINNKKYNLPHNFLLSPCFIILKKLRIIINRKVNITVRNKLSSFVFARVRNRYWSLNQWKNLKYIWKFSNVSFILLNLI